MAFLVADDVEQVIHQRHRVIVFRLAADRAQVRDAVERGPGVLQCPKVDLVAGRGSGRHDDTLPLLLSLHQLSYWRWLRTQRT